jgi:hypothetical protein
MMTNTLVKKIGDVYNVHLGSVMTCLNDHFVMYPNIFDLKPSLITLHLLIII